jgi:hypothetical protein
MASRPQTRSHLPINQIKNIFRYFNVDNVSSGQIKACQLSELNYWGKGLDSGYLIGKILVTDMLRDPQKIPPNAISLFIIIMFLNLNS